jgi:hypothetical protein
LPTGQHEPWEPFQVALTNLTEKYAQLIFDVLMDNGLYDTYGNVGITIWMLLDVDVGNGPTTRMGCVHNGG